MGSESNRRPNADRHVAARRTAHPKLRRSSLAHSKLLITLSCIKLALYCQWTTAVTGKKLIILCNCCQIYRRIRNMSIALVGMYPSFPCFSHRKICKILFQTKPYRFSFKLCFSTINEEDILSISIAGRGRPSRTAHSQSRNGRLWSVYVFGGELCRRGAQHRRSGRASIRYRTRPLFPRH